MAQARCEIKRETSVCSLLVLSVWHSSLPSLSSRIPLCTGRLPVLLLLGLSFAHQVNISLLSDLSAYLLVTFSLNIPFGFMWFHQIWLFSFLWASSH